MADEYNRTWPEVDRTYHGIDILRECAQGIVDCHDAQPGGLQKRNHFAPARCIDPGPVDDHDGRSIVVTRHLRASASGDDDRRQRQARMVPERHACGAFEPCVPTSGYARRRRQP